MTDELIESFEPDIVINKSDENVWTIELDGTCQMEFDLSSLNSTINLVEKALGSQLGHRSVRETLSFKLDHVLLSTTDPKVEDLIQLQKNWKTFRTQMLSLLKDKKKFAATPVSIVHQIVDPTIWLTDANWLVRARAVVSLNKFKRNFSLSSVIDDHDLMHETYVLARFIDRIPDLWEDDDDDARRPVLDSLVWLNTRQLRTFDYVELVKRISILNDVVDRLVGVQS